MFKEKTDVCLKMLNVIEQFFLNFNNILKMFLHKFQFECQKGNVLQFIVDVSTLKQTDDAIENKWNGKMLQRVKTL